MTAVQKVDLTGITYEQQDRPPIGHRWLFKLSEPIPYTNDYRKPYSEGELSTDHVIVSWGRYGDTLIAPAAINKDKGYHVIADMLGYWSEGTWVDAEDVMREWFSA